MYRSRRDIELEVIEYSKRLSHRGWVANHDGNITVRVDEDQFLATPTAFAKQDVERESLLYVNGRAEKVSGRTRPFSELNLHLFAYRARADIAVVIHAHPIHACAFAVRGEPILPTMLAESVVSLGAEIPLVPYARPKTPESTQVLSKALAESDVLVMENHGVLAVGPDLETAYLRLELVEHLATIQFKATQLGGARTIPAEDIGVLLEARNKAGLGFPRKALDFGRGQRRLRSI